MFLFEIELHCNTGPARGARVKTLTDRARPQRSGAARPQNQPRSDTIIIINAILLRRAHAAQIKFIYKSRAPCNCINQNDKLIRLRR